VVNSSSCSQFLKSNVLQRNTNEWRKLLQRKIRSRLELVVALMTGPGHLGLSRSLSDPPACSPPPCSSRQPPLPTHSFPPPNLLLHQYLCHSHHFQRRRPRVWVLGPAPTDEPQQGLRAVWVQPGALTVDGHFQDDLEKVGGVPPGLTPSPCFVQHASQSVYIHLSSGGKEGTRGGGGVETWFTPDPYSGTIQAPWKADLLYLSQLFQIIHKKKEKETYPKSNDTQLVKKIKINS
jgi:hypothetical protein